jgi:hypothetical protein
VSGSEEESSRAHRDEGTMTTLATLQRDRAASRHWQGAVAEAAMPFESRWTFAALKRASADIHRRLIDQRALFDRALLTGTADDIEAHGAALCRGYTKAIQALEAVAAPDDAYLIGQDVRTGFRVAISQQKAAAQRIRELHGNKVIWITPDEVAGILANIEAFKPIAAIKRLFPGAEMLDLHPREPAQGD